WKSCTRGRCPVYSGYIPRTSSPHCDALWMSLPPAHVPPQLLAALQPADQQPAGTPANEAPALNTSGYTASKACVIIAPEESPVAYTRSAFAPYVAIVYFTICATAWVSPPPSCVRDCFEPTSQQFAELAG